MAVHHDESMHGYFSYLLAIDHSYTHSPLFHGAFQYHLLASIFSIFSSNEFTLRIVSAISGCLCVMISSIYFSNKSYLVSLCILLLLIFSPSLLYFSRFARNDTLVLFLFILLIISSLSYINNGQYKYIYINALILSLGAITKESFFILCTIITLYFILSFAKSFNFMIKGIKFDLDTLNLIKKIPLMPILYIFSLLPSKFNFNTQLNVRQKRTSELIILNTVLLGLFTGPIIKVIHISINKFVGIDYFLQNYQYFLICCVVSTSIGYIWNIKKYVVSLLIFLIVMIPFYILWGQGFEGLISLFWNTIDYWLSQQNYARGSQPFYYYLFILLSTESFLIIIALYGFLLSKKNISIGTLDGMLIFWGATSFLFLSIAGEKMPWLVINITFPFVVFSARQLPIIKSDIIYKFSRLTFKYSHYYFASLIGLILLITNATASFYLVYITPDVPTSPLIYTQTSYEVKNINKYILNNKLDSESLLIDRSFGMTWPWAWYFRNTLNVDYIEIKGNDINNLEANYLLLSKPKYSLLLDQNKLNNYTYIYEYKLRTWFPEQIYKNTGDLTFIKYKKSSLLKNPLNIVDYLLFGIDRSKLSSENGVFMIRN
jgi:uncharacterized protein (TIGR03663 family)|tara:strand:- start:2897 stop:4702 length:1806 start_codon:yes stop_codon:yes gene_type:complete